MAADSGHLAWPSEREMVQQLAASPTSTLFHPVTIEGFNAQDLFVTSFAHSLHYRLPMQP